MGVTLERVQNKFACIIGELCSEPLVLSQFAVWVDLRIAEYKTNGTISLDCSGDSPNPKWMKGVKNHPPRAGPNSMDTGQHPHFRQDSYSASPAASPSFDRESSQSSQPTYSRLSPDIVVVKEEQNFDEQSSCTLSRKRHSDGNDWQNDFYSPSKSRRLGNNSTTLSSAQESSSNQSLMSIINTETDTTALEQVDPSDTDIFQSPMGTTQSDFNTSQGSSSDFSSHLPSSSSPSQSTWSSQFNQSAQGSSSQGDAYLQEYFRVGQGQENSTYTTLKNTASQVGIYHRWVEKAHPDHMSRIEETDPETLDKHLSDFFSTIKQKGGKDYLWKSYLTIRESLIRHLKLNNYPHSLLHSPLFAGSREAYRIKARELKFREKQRKMALKMAQQQL